MNKIIKISLPIMVLLLLSGCTATYNIEITDNQVKENLNFIEMNSNILDNKYISDNMNDDYQYTYRGLIDDEYSSKTYAYIDSNNILYKKEKLTENGLGISYKYNFLINNYYKSTIANNGFTYFNVLQEKDVYTISTSNRVIAFDDYKNLDSLTVHLKTNHKVKNTNADKIDGVNYYWEINRSNYINKNIYIELYKDKYIFNYENSVIKIIIGVVLVAILIFAVIIFLRKKSNKNNKL